MSEQTPQRSESTQQCPVCGETSIHHERVYTINGQRVTMRFAACLHPAGAAQRSGLHEPSEPPRK